MSNSITSFCLWCPTIASKCSEKKKIKRLKNRQKRFYEGTRKAKNDLYSFLSFTPPPPTQWFLMKIAKTTQFYGNRTKAKTSSSKLRTRLAETLVSVSKKKIKKLERKKWGGGFREMNGQKGKTKVRKVFQKVLLFSILRPIACSPSPKSKVLFCNDDVSGGSQVVNEVLPVTQADAGDILLPKSYRYYQLYHSLYRACWDRYKEETK